MKNSGQKFWTLLAISLLLVIPSGFEPETHSLEGCCSIQLSYGTSIGKCGCKVRHFFANNKILDLKSDVGTVIERIIALGKGFGGLKLTDIQWVNSALVGQSGFRGFECGFEEGIAVRS